jgi:hypothetical protein
MPVPDHSSPVNEWPRCLLPVDNFNDEVINNPADTKLVLFTNYVVKTVGRQWPPARLLDIGVSKRGCGNIPGE